MVDWSGGGGTQAFDSLENVLPHVQERQVQGGTRWCRIPISTGYGDASSTHETFVERGKRGGKPSGRQRIYLTVWRGSSGSRARASTGTINRRSWGEGWSKDTKLTNYPKQPVYGDERGE